MDKSAVIAHGTMSLGKRCKTEQIEIKALGEYIKPVKAKRGSIGFDLAVPEDVVIPAHSRTVVKLNFAISLPPGYEAKIEPRSGFSSKGMEGFGTKYERKRFLCIFRRKVAKSGLMRWDADVLVGKIDPYYTDSIGVIIKNNDEQFTIRKGTRIAQMTFYKTPQIWFKEVDELSCPSRGGGFESSGTSSDSIKKDYSSAAEEHQNNLENGLPPTRIVE